MCQVVTPARVMVIIFEAPEVVIPPVPNTSNMFASGTAVPLLVTNSVGILGLFFTTLISPACEISCLCLLRKF